MCFFLPPVLTTTTVQLIRLNVRNQAPSLCAAFSVGTDCQAYLNLKSLYSKRAAPSIKHDPISPTLLCSAAFLWHHCEGCAAGDFSALPLILPECVFVCCYLECYMVRHIGNLLAIMNVHVRSQTCLYDFVCARAFEGEEKEGGREGDL